jgi:hypothetical protein
VSPGSLGVWGSWVKRDSGNVALYVIDSVDKSYEAGGDGICLRNIHAQSAMPECTARVLNVPRLY